MKKIIISGRVQGIGLRYTIESHARKLGLTGTVRNLYDGTVEIIVQGDMQNIFLEWLKQSPGASEVKNMIIDEFPDQKFDSFKIIR